MSVSVIMSCANCGVRLEDGVPRIESVYSTWNTTPKLLTPENVELPPAPSEDSQLFLPTTTEKEISSPPNLNDADPGNLTATETTPSSSRISIMSALSRIFEISPLRLKEVSEIGENEFHDLVHVFKTSSQDSDVDTSFIFCSDCGGFLTPLYNSFLDFVKILRVEGELGKKLKELEEQRKTVTPPTKKRGRPKKEQKSKEENILIKMEGVDLENLSEDGSRRSKILKREQLEVVMDGSASASESDVDIKEHYSYDIRSEGLPVSDLDSEDDFPNYKRFRKNSDDDDSTPPDSPINLDPEPQPRSPRPVRQSSARNKDWSSYYKEEDEEEEELLEVPLEEDNRIQNDDVLGDGNETEVTATEAEGDDDDDEDDEEVPHPDVETILGKVEVNWKEGYADDDSDEDYAPDSDLENLLAQDSTRGGRRQKKLTKRAFSIRKVYECETCGKLYAHLKSLQIHHRTHLLDNKELYPCEICYKDFSCDELLKRHRRQFHGEYIPYRMKSSDVDLEALYEQAKKLECPICHELFQKSDLQTHVSEHKVEFPWQCPLCPCAMSTLTEFTRHKVLLHHQRPKFSCDVCNKYQFRSLFHLKNHQAAVHNARSDKLDESSSSSETENNQKLATDGEHTSSRKRRKYKCSECKKKYSRLDHLKEHLITHGIGDKFKCTICGREFTHDSSRKRHMLLHADVNQYKCVEMDCNKAFSRKDHLSRHMDSIHGIQLAAADIVASDDEQLTKQPPKAKEIPCPYCNKLVKRERMRLHLVSHTGEKKHLCKQCGQRFGLRTTLRTHIQCVHQDIRRYACTFCSLAFKRSNHLKDHIKLHTEADNKPFQCDQCAKTFRREKNLKSHMVTHYGGKDFMCEQCGKAFNRVDNMKAHVKSVHEGIQIRKKKSAKNQTTKRKKNQQTPLEIEFSVEKGQPETEDVSDQPTADLNLVVSASPTIQDTTSTGPTVIMRTTSKRPQRKRANKSKILQIDHPQEAEIETETLPTEVQAPPPGTIVTLVGPGMGNVISADALAGLGTVQIQEIHGTVDGEAGETFEGPDGQRTTILQLAPGQAFPATSGQYETTYYQYTYYHQE